MKFNFKHCAIALGLAAIMTSCWGGDKPSTTSEWFVCTDDSGEKFGFFNPGTGKVIYEEEFKEAPTSIIDGIFIVDEKNGVSVYSAADEKNPKIVGDLDELKDAGGVAEGLLPVVRQNSRIEVYSVSPAKAELAFTLDPVDGYEITGCRGSYSDGLLVVNNEEGKWGAVDKKGNVVIDIKYDGVGTPSNGILLVAKQTDDEEAVVYALDYKGEEIFKYKKGLMPRSEGILDNGYFLAQNDNDRFVLIDKNGETFNLPKDIDQVEDVVGDFLVFRSNGSYGIIKIKGEDSEIVVKAKYESIQLVPWEPTKFVCSKDGDDYELMDIDGNRIANFGDDYKTLIPYHTPNWKGFVATESGRSSECVCFDSKGEKIKFADVREIYGLFVRESYSSYVSSDYFNLDEFVNKVSEAISVDGLCGYRMGEYVNPYFSDDMNARNYTYTYWFTPKDEPDVNGYRYSSTLRLSGYRSLASSSWDYSTYSTSYYFVPDNPIDGMELTINGPNDLWEKAGDKIKQDIEDKGFILETDSSTGLQYYTPNRDATLTVSWSSWGTIVLKYYKVY